DYPGNYSMFREWQKEQKQEKTIAVENKPTTKAEGGKALNKDKATYNQKKEFEQIQSDIAKLEDEKKELMERIAEGVEDHRDLMEWSTRIQEIDQLIEVLEMRWLQLSELDGIE